MMRSSASGILHRSVESLVGGCRNMCPQYKSSCGPQHKMIFRTGSTIHGSGMQMNLKTGWNQHFRRCGQSNFGQHTHRGGPSGSGMGMMILRPLIFTVGIGAASLVGCTIAHYERTRQQIEWREMFNRQRNVFKAGDWRQKINAWWQDLSQGRKVAAGIIALNAGVFLCWRIAPMQRLMGKWFTSGPANKSSLPLLLSCFSHTDFWHIGSNMFVLWSFAPLINSILGPEQFLGFYLTGGVVASLASLYFKMGTATMTASLGASGALTAVLGACCVERPETRLAIIFLPFFSFSAQTALICLVGFDVCGLLFRFRFFDHAAHLGGTLFGVAYMKHLQEVTWDKRGELVRAWHKFRENEL